MSTIFNSEAQYLQQYNIKDFDVPLVSVDIVILTIHDQQLKVLLVERGDYPSKGLWALPGGFIDLENDKVLSQTALRKLAQKTHINAPYLEQLVTIGNDARDPRGWSVTTVYFALIPYVKLQSKSRLDEHLAWYSIKDASALSLAFDHSEILKMAVDRVRSKVLYTLIPAYLINSPFTLLELQQAYEIILDKKIEKKSLRRRLEKSATIIATGELSTQHGGRPAALYKLKDPFAKFSFARQLHD